MRNIKELITETEKNLDFYLSSRLADYCESSTYIYDAISEIVDADCPCYYSDLIAWFKDTTASEDYINDAVKEYGLDSKDFDILKVIAWGWCEWARQQIEDEKSDALLLAAFCFVRDNLKLEEITEEQAEEIENINFDSLDSFIDLQNEINTIFEVEE